jgi:hypothetical protein
VSEPSAAKPTWTSPPRQGERAPAGAAEFVICDHTIEQGFEETKTELGMAHYEGRKYPGWHHHILTCMLAHFFLWHLQIRLGEKSPSADGVPGADLAGSDLALAHVHGGGCP